MMEPTKLLLKLTIDELGKTTKIQKVSRKLFQSRNRGVVNG